MVELQNIEKSFGKLSVLQGISVSLEKGKTTAILGPNGSGKTTLMKCILGLVIPNKGKISVNGVNIKNNWNYRSNIGYLPQIARFPENLTVTELFSMVQDLRQHKVPYDNLIALFKLSSFLNKPLRSLSGGTRQKVNMVMALMFDPEIYIFDEPTVGLDPISCVRFKEFVKNEKRKLKTVLITTHILSEVEELADDIIFLLDGKIFYHGSPQELISKYQEKNLERAIAKMLENYEQKDNKTN
ncbi:MAG: ABC transporter ATP-binding protein [Bacteroidia bacterium]